ncbi:hypothetical protein T10_11535, partial [Trichinella papuae]
LIMKTRTLADRKWRTSSGIEIIQKRKQLSTTSLERKLAKRFNCTCDTSCISSEIMHHCNSSRHRPAFKLL